MANIHKIDDPELKSVVLAAAKKQFQKANDEEVEFIKDKIAEWLRKGIIRRSDSQYSSPILLVPKVGVSKDRYRLCVNNCPLLRNCYIKQKEKGLQHWMGWMGTTSLPSRKKINIKLLSQLRWGTWSSTSLSREPALLNKCAVAFVDDILVFSQRARDHAKDVERVLNRLIDDGYRFNWSKCKFGQTSLTWCGRIVSKEGVALDQSKVAALKRMRHPKNFKELEIFIGLCVWHSSWVKGYGRIMEPSSVECGIKKQRWHSKRCWKQLNQRPSSVDQVQGYTNCMLMPQM